MQIPLTRSCKMDGVSGNDFPLFDFGRILKVDW